MAKQRADLGQPVQCCEKDTNFDGNCPVHSAPGVFRQPQLNENGTPPEAPKRAKKKRQRDPDIKARYKIDDIMTELEPDIAAEVYRWFVRKYQTGPTQ